MNGLPKLAEPVTSKVEEIVNEIEYSSQLIARTWKLEMGVTFAMPIGFVIGFLMVFLLVILPLLYMG